MKKALDIFIIIIIFFILYFLQVNFFTWFNIVGIMPNMFIILIGMISLFTNEDFGMAFGLGFGLLLDFFIGSRIGIYTLAFLIIGFIAGKLKKEISKNSKISIIYLIIILTIIFELIVYSMRIAFLNINIELINFIKIILIEVFYNSILVIIFYPLIYKFGNKLEEDFINYSKFSKLFNIK